ncbi:hypothetical protein SDJN02_03935, partial [Cucurbita argyrosperma subsp. argyrosperma]
MRFTAERSRWRKGTLTCPPPMTMPSRFSVTVFHYHKESAALGEMQAKVEKEMGAVQGLPPSRISLRYVKFEISYEATVATSICLIIISYTDPAGAAVSRERKEEEADSRSVFVGNVRLELWSLSDHFFLFETEFNKYPLSFVYKELLKSKSEPIIGEIHK